MSLRYLSLFSGIGGGDLGCQRLLGWRCVGYVEQDGFCCDVLEQRIKDGFLDDAPIFQGDVRKWISNGYAESYSGLVEVVTAGFPCQPFSVAGKGRAGDDERNMWPATQAVLSRVRPRYAFLENVPGLLSKRHNYFGVILGDLAALGYDARWGVVGADNAGAPHQRKRLWIVATHTDGEELRQKPIGQ